MERVLSYAPSRIWLLLILTLSALLNVWRLGAKSLWLDEIHTYRFATMPASDFWSLMAHREANMVLYYVLLRPWLAVGDSEAWMRGLSAIVTVGAVGGVYWLSRRLYGRRVGLIAAFLLAINPGVIANGQEARGYAVFLLLALVATALLIRAVDGHLRDWLRYVVVASLTVYSHLFGSLVVLAHGVAALAFVPRSILPWRRLVAVGGAVAVLTLPLTLFVLTAADRKLGWVSEPGFRTFVGIFAALAGSKWLLAAYGLLVLVAVVVATRGWTSGDARAWGSFLLVSWLVLPPAVAFAISPVKPALVPRFFFTGVAPMVILAAVGLERTRSAAMIGGCLLVIVGLTVPQLLAHYREPFEDWRGAIQHVVGHAAAQDAMVFYTSTGRHALAYYTRNLSAPRATVIAPIWKDLKEMGARSADLDAIRQGYPRVWLVLSHTDTGPEAAVRDAMQDALRAQYRSMDLREFTGVRVVVYDNESRKDPGD